MIDKSYVHVFKDFSPKLSPIVLCLSPDPQSVDLRSRYSSSRSYQSYNDSPTSSVYTWRPTGNVQVTVSSQSSSHNSSPVFLLWPSSPWKSSCPLGAMSKLWSNLREIVRSCARVGCCLLYWATVSTCFWIQTTHYICLLQGSWKNCPPRPSHIQTSGQTSLCHIVQTKHTFTAALKCIYVNKCRMWKCKSFLADDKF